MPAPVITNPYSADNKLQAYVGEPFSVRLAVSHSPTRVGVTGNWIGWSYRWLIDTQEIELLITPPRVLTDEIGVRAVARNADGNSETFIPYTFRQRTPVIADIPDQKFGRGQKDVDFIIPIEHRPNVIGVRGDCIGLHHQGEGEGVRIFGDIADGELLKDRGTFIVSATNATGMATPKTGNWRIYPRPSAVRNLTAASTRTGIVTLDWDAPTDNGGFSITNHQWRVGEEGEWIRTGSATTQAILPDAFEAGTYEFYVRPENSEGIIGIEAGPVSETVVRQSVPGRVTNLQATVSGLHITWTWDAPLDDGNTPITRYEVDSGTGFVSNGTSKTFSKTFTSAGIRSISVRAVNAIGAGPSDSASGTITVTVPGQVTGVSASVSGTQITWTWGAPSNGGSPIIRYEVSRDSGTWLSVGTSRSYAYTGSRGRSYSLRVQAVNAVGEGAASSSVSASIPIVAPSAPRNLRRTSTGFSWDVPLDWGGEIGWYESSLDAATWKRTDTSSLPSSWDDPGTHTYSVKAVNSAGESPIASVSYTIVTAPSAPRNVKRNANGSFSWDAPSNNGGDPNITYTWSYDFGTWGTSAPPASASAPGSHTFRVRAHNSGGTSPVTSLNYTIAPLWTQSRYSHTMRSNGIWAVNMSRLASGETSFSLVGEAAHAVGRHRRSGNTITARIYIQGNVLRVRLENPSRQNVNPVNIIFSASALNVVMHANNSAGSATATFIVSF